MSTELEKDVTEALRFRADEVPETPCPPLGFATRSRRGWLVPVAAAAAVVGLAAAVAFLPGDAGSADGPGITAVAPDRPAAGEVYYSHTKSRVGSGIVGERELWQGPGRADAWREKVVGMVRLPAGRPSGDNGSPDGTTDGECWPAPSTTDAACTAPGSWFSPNIEFLASVPRDPVVIKRQLRQDATAEEARRTATGGDFTATPDTFSDENLDYLAFNYLRSVLSANGLPADLEQALEQVIATMPGIQTARDMANLGGERGIGYSLPDHRGALLTVIFDNDHHYIGSPEESFERGFAPGIGQPPSRMIG